MTKSKALLVSLAVAVVGAFGFWMSLTSARASAMTAARTCETDGAAAFLKFDFVDTIGSQVTGVVVASPVLQVASGQETRPVRVLGYIVDVVINDDLTYRFKGAPCVDAGGSAAHTTTSVFTLDSERHKVFQRSLRLSPCEGRQWRDVTSLNEMNVEVISD